MTNILLAVSFIIHFILILWIILLNLKTSQLKETETRLVNLQKETEDLFSSYILEFKEENERLLNFSNKKSASTNAGFSGSMSNDDELRNKIKPKEPHQDHPEQQHSKNEKKLSVNSTPSSNAMKQVGAYSQFRKEKQNVQTNFQAQDDVYNPPEQEDQPVYVQSLAAQALLLKKQGHSIEEIAKKLNKGRTEIELSLKFHQET